MNDSVSRGPQDDEPIPAGLLEGIEQMRRDVRTAVERAKGLAARLKAAGAKMKEWEG